MAEINYQENEKFLSDCRQGNVEKIKQFIAQGKNPAHAIWCGRDGLDEIITAQFDNLHPTSNYKECAEILIESGVDPYQVRYNPLNNERYSRLDGFQQYLWSGSDKKFDKIIRGEENEKEAKRLFKFLLELGVSPLYDVSEPFMAMAHVSGTTAKDLQESAIVGKEYLKEHFPVKYAEQLSILDPDSYFSNKESIHKTLGLSKKLEKNCDSHSKNKVQKEKSFWKHVLSKCGKTQ